jgi:hypothetical protein
MLSAIVRLLALAVAVAAVVFAVMAVNNDATRAAALAWTALATFAGLIVLCEYAREGGLRQAAMRARALKRAQQELGELAHDLIGASALITAAASRAHALNDELS